MVFCAGEYCGDMSALTHICGIDSGVTRDDGRPMTTLEEACITLEMCTKRYSTPAPEGPALTVFLGRKVHGRTTSLARLDILLREGLAHTSIVAHDAPRTDTEPVVVQDDDDVATIVREILAKHLGRG